MERHLRGLRVFCPHHREVQERAAVSPGGASSTMGGGGDGEPASKRRRPDPDAEGCDFVGEYGDLLSRHLGECPFVDVPCAKGCGQRVQRRLLESHYEVCSTNYENCEICGERVRAGKMGEHRRERAEEHVAILEKRLVEKEEEGEGRMKRMEAALATQGEALQRIESKHGSLDSQVAKLDSQILRLGAASITTLQWPVEIEKVIDKVGGKVGAIVESGEMRLGDALITCQLYPCRAKESVPAGDVGMFIFIRGDIFFWGTLQVTDSAGEELLRSVFKGICLAQGKGQIFRYRGPGSILITVTATKMAAFGGDGCVDQKCDCWAGLSSDSSDESDSADSD